MKKNDTLTKDEKLFIISCLVLLFLLSFFLYFDLTRHVKAEDQTVIGKTLFKEKDVRRKYSAQVVWESLQQGNDLFNKDTIITGTDSKTNILLKDGTVIELNEDNLVVFELHKNEVAINLKSGHINIKRMKGKDADRKPFIIKTGDNVIKLNAGELTVSKNKGEDPVLFVQSGRVETIVNNKELTIETGDRALLKENSIEVERNEIILSNPEDNKRYYIIKNHKDISFSWNFAEKKADNEKSVYELSGNRDFSHIFKRLTLSDNKTVVSLPEGEFFWRLSKQNPKTGKFKSSEIRRLSIIRDLPIQLLGPADGEILDYAYDPPSINFAWEAHKHASSYELEISETGDFSKILKNIDSESVNFIYKWEWDIKPGDVKTYYWRVKADNKMLNWSGMTSPINHFSIKKLDFLGPLELIAPADKKKISRFLVEKENVMFSWKKADQKLKIKLFFSKTDSFNTIYKHIETDSNYWVMKNSFPKGIYYWRVGLFDINRNRMVFSGSRLFESTDVFELTLLSPANKSEIDSWEIKDTGLRFSWQRLDISGAFVLEISNNNNFTKIHDSINTRSYSTLLFKLTPGEFYWRVKLLDDNNKILAESETRKFNIRDSLPDPLPISPVNGRLVEMSVRNKLDFEWKPSRGADAYEIELHQIVNKKRGGIEKRVMASETNNLKYTIHDLNVLDIGSFYWTLQAVKKDRRGTIIRASKKIKNSFNIDLNHNPSKIIITSPELQVVPDGQNK